MDKTSAQPQVILSLLRKFFQISASVISDQPGIFVDYYYEFFGPAMPSGRYI
jgi:hypothetical protein